MKRFMFGVALLATFAGCANASAITDLFSQVKDFDLIKTPLAITTLSKEKNVAMEVFRSGGMKGSLYENGYGVKLVKASGLLPTSMTVEGFYNGNFDLTVKYAGVMTMEPTLTAREVKPDGTPAEYAGQEATITPCLVIKDLIYVPLPSNIPVMGYYSNNDPTGFDNLHFDAVTMPNIAETIAGMIGGNEALVALIKAAITSSMENETIKNLVGSLIDRIVGDGSDASYLKLLDDAKLNAFQLKIGATTVNFNGYELHTVGSGSGETTVTVNDRILPVGTLNELGYAVKSDTDPARQYRIAYRIGNDGKFEIYNFNNAGMALHTVPATVTKPDGTQVKGFENVLSPVTGEMNVNEGKFALDVRQQLGAEAISVTDLFGGALNSVRGYQLCAVVPAMLNGILNLNYIRPAWTTNTPVENSMALDKPRHYNGFWHEDSKGNLVTKSNAAEITVGDYCPAKAYYYVNGTSTPLSTTDGPLVYDTKWTIEGLDVAAITHKVNLALAVCSFTAHDFLGKEPGVLVQGSVGTDDTTNPYVESYDLFLVPVEVNDVVEKDKPLIGDNRIFQFHPDNGLQYRYDNGPVLDPYSDWADAIELSDKYTVQHVDAPKKAAADGAPAKIAANGTPTQFSKFVPYTDMTKWNKVKSGISHKWEAGHPDDKDTYSVYVKVNYTPESGLEPTYHALSTFKDGDPVVSGIEEVEINDAVSGDAVYYNIQGVRVDASDLTPGVYVRVLGDKSDKVIIR